MQNSQSLLAIVLVVTSSPLRKVLQVAPNSCPCTTLIDRIYFAAYVTFHIFYFAAVLVVVCQSHINMMHYTFRNLLKTSCAKKLVDILQRTRSRVDS